MTDIDELRKRHRLLTDIKRMEATRTGWTPIEELRKRAEAAAKAAADRAAARAKKNIPVDEELGIPDELRRPRG